MAILSRRTLAAVGLVAAAAVAPLAAQTPTTTPDTSKSPTTTVSTTAGTTASAAPSPTPSSAPTPAQAPAPAPSPITVGGVVYAQWGAQLDSLSPANNFDVSRSYINVIGRFNGGIMTRITADIYRDGDATAGGALNYRLKYAYAAWNPQGSPLTFRFGLTQAPWLDWEEQLWDFRMQGPMALDRSGYLSSSDFGLAVDGNFNNETVDFQAMAMNGENYNKTPGDSHKDFAGRLSVRLVPTDDGSRVGGLRITGYAQLGTPTSGGTRNRFIGLVSYRAKNLLLAGEFASTKDTVTNPAKASTTGRVISAYGFYHLPASPVGIIARVDVVDPNTSVANDGHTDLIGGLFYQLSSNVRLLADVDRVTLQASGSKSVTQALFQTQFTF